MAHSLLRLGAFHVLCPWVQHWAVVGVVIFFSEIGGVEGIEPIDWLPKLLLHSMCPESIGLLWRGQIVLEEQSWDPSTDSIVDHIWHRKHACQNKFACNGHIAMDLRSCPTSRLRFGPKILRLSNGDDVA